MSPWTPRSGCRLPVFTACILAVLVGVAGGPAAARAPQEASAASAATPAVAARSSAPALSDAEIEQFLQKGKIAGRTRGAGKGVTDSVRATLSDGRLTHDVHIQTVDEHRREFTSKQGTEFDFRDSWTFNVAAYRLDRLLGLEMVPVSVERHYRSSRAAFTWWLDNIMMDEGGRVKKNVTPPGEQSVYWTQQLYLMRVFDQLIYNTDRNYGNQLIGEDWRLWAIDHTRAFRKHATLRAPAQVTRCDRAVFERLKALDMALLSKELGRYIDRGQIAAILKRRDLIVERLESRGPGALFDRQPHAEPGVVALQLD